MSGTTCLCLKTRQTTAWGGKQSGSVVCMIAVSSKHQVSNSPSVGCQFWQLISDKPLSSSLRASTITMTAIDTTVTIMATTSTSSNNNNGNNCTSSKTDRYWARDLLWFDTKLGRRIRWPFYSTSFLFVSVSASPTRPTFTFTFTLSSLPYT